MSQQRTIILKLCSMFIGTILGVVSLYFFVVGIHSLYCNNINETHKTHEICKPSFHHPVFNEGFPVHYSTLEVKEKEYVLSMIVVLLKLVSILSVIYFLIIGFIGIFVGITIIIIGIIIVGLTIFGFIGGCIGIIWIIFTGFSYIFSPTITINCNTNYEQI